MRKRLKQGFASVLALLMVLGGMQLAPLKAQAATTETKTYTMAQISTTVAWDVAETDMEAGAKRLSFAGNWKNIFFAVPAEIDFAKVTKITFNVTSGNADKFAYKTFTETAYANKANTNTEVKYGQNSFVPDESKRTGVKYLGITSIHGSDASDTTPVEMEIASISFEIDNSIVPVSIQTDLMDWKDAITRDLGADTIAGAAVTGNEFNDAFVAQLVNKHCNAITLGNELKPDALFGYSSTHTALQTITFNGESLQVPTLNFNNADAKLNLIQQWNAEHPSEPIKVRGHVLVWHSQTPTWFFRENYDASGAYVSKEVMNKRMEWFIKSVLEHYVGANSAYKDMFYGWDVVNEAISDSTGMPRKASENSDWAAVYGDQSNEFIINAFKYANKYAPATLELYYNDYNSFMSPKIAGIEQLLKDIKVADGTRIDAMGMQAHFLMGWPDVTAIENGIRTFSAVVGKVQLTELDVKASSSYDGTAATQEEEYKKMGERYKAIYDVCKKLDAEDSIEVSGITFWGTVDKYSWLQSSNSVGGASDGGPQCPMMFDDNYQAKPAYWAFVDPTKLPGASTGDNNSGGNDNNDGDDNNTGDDNNDGGDNNDDDNTGDNNDGSDNDDGNNVGNSGSSSIPMPSPSPAPAPAPAPTPAPAVQAATNPYPVPAVTIRSGHGNRDAVRWLQTELVAAGYSLTVDGLFGRGTKAALMDYQLRHGLAVDGICGRMTIQTLQADAANAAPAQNQTQAPVVSGDGSNPYPTPTGTVRSGNRSAVRWLQAELVQAGYNIAVDGLFGRGTKAALMDYQLRHGLSVDGVCGRMTIQNLLAN